MSYLSILQSFWRIFWLTELWWIPWPNFLYTITWWRSITYSCFSPFQYTKDFLETAFSLFSFLLFLSLFFLSLEMDDKKTKGESRQKERVESRMDDNKNMLIWLQHFFIFNFYFSSRFSFCFHFHLLSIGGKTTTKLDRNSLFSLVNLERRFWKSKIFLFVNWFKKGRILDSTTVLSFPSFTTN